jgi:hypothetical protein
METETTLFAGTGAQTSGDRWGDYSSMAIDNDGCTFWYAQEYYATSNGDNWQTRLVQLKFNGCQ